MVRSGNTVLKSLNGDDDDVVYSGEEILFILFWWKMEMANRCAWEWEGQLLGGFYRQDQKKG